MIDPHHLSELEIKRYHRQIIIPEVGFEGQLKLKEAKVLLVGVGGLGSPLAIYLAAAGIGTIGLVDFDTVDYSNLHRQILHDTCDVGTSKLQSAKKRLLAINPEIDVILHETYLSPDNATELISKYDIVCDGTDNFATRYLINDACYLLGKINVFGSISQFEGQVTVFSPIGPCYRCIYEEPPRAGEVLNCAESGVIGILPGIIGSLQATEVIKLLLGIGEPLVGTLLHVNALDSSFRSFGLRKNSGCKLCGHHPEIVDLKNEQSYCQSIILDPSHEISVKSYQSMRAQDEEHLLIDVREAFEHEYDEIDNHLSIPLATLHRKFDILPRSIPIVIYCHSGIRSAQAVSILLEQGFDKVYNLVGGIVEWNRYTVLHSV
ncbi:MAG: molybdopterin-synthase adenylyltransferase MoeB [Candidatus Heimdallarchaeota archaeon]|nr:molybdopterin-synthase adenylyltransferase MoeB [Candidatus Heimdallarchaeota archaeon]